MPRFTPIKPDGWEGEVIVDGDGLPDRAVMDVADSDLAVVRTRGRGYHGTVTDTNTGKRWRVYGASCGLPGCMCAARVVPGEGGQAVMPPKRTFVIHSEAWWSEANPLREDAAEEVSVTFDAGGSADGPHGEFVVRWYRLMGGGSDVSPRIEAFGDASAVLATLASEGFYRRLAEAGVHYTPAQFIDILADLGFQDATDRRSANKNSGRRCPACGQPVNP